MSDPLRIFRLYIATSSRLPHSIWSRIFSNIWNLTIARRDHPNSIFLIFSCLSLSLSASFPRNVRFLFRTLFILSFPTSYEPSFPIHHRKTIVHLPSIPLHSALSYILRTLLAFLHHLHLFLFFSLFIIRCHEWISFVHYILLYFTNAHMMRCLKFAFLI